MKTKKNIFEKYKTTTHKSDLRLNQKEKTILETINLIINGIEINQDRNKKAIQLLTLIKKLILS